MEDFHWLCCIYYVGDFMLKRVSLVLVILMLFLSASNASAYAPTDDVAGEIISLELSLSSGQKKLEEINRDIDAIADQIEGLRSEEEKIEKLAADSRERLKYWYRFMYIDGNISLLEVILNSEDISDLFSRIYYIESIQEYYMDHLDSLNSLKQKKEKLSSELALKLNNLKVARNELNAAIENIQRLIAEKQRLYQMALTDEDMQRQIKEGEALLERFEVLNYLITNLSDLPWESIQPSSIQINSMFSAATATIDESSIEGIIHSGENLKDVSLHITKSGFVISGPSSDKTAAFTMEGEMRLSDNNTIEFIPASLVIDNLIIDNEGLEKILNSSELKLTLPPLPLNLKVMSLTPKDGYITLELIR